MHEMEHQTDTEKSKKLTSELSSINDKVSRNEGVVKEQQVLVHKENKALDEASTEHGPQGAVQMDIQQKRCLGGREGQCQNVLANQ